MPSETQGTGHRAMTNEEPIQQAVRNLIARYGHDAPRQAAVRANELRAAGDAEGHAMWREIQRAVAAALKDPSRSLH
jgi:hypothetical protein